VQTYGGEVEPVPAAQLVVVGPDPTPLHSEYQTLLEVADIMSISTGLSSRHWLRVSYLGNPGVLSRLPGSVTWLFEATGVGSSSKITKFSRTAAVGDGTADSKAGGCRHIVEAVEQGELKCLLDHKRAQLQSEKRKQGEAGGDGRTEDDSEGEGNKTRMIAKGRGTKSKK
jgi:hypothetical protein